MSQYQNILVPLDGSSLAERALAPAVTIAQAMGAHLVLLRVVPPIMLTVDPQLYEQLTRQSEDEATAYLHQVQANLANETAVSSETAVSTETLIINGPAAATIIQVAQERACNLIIMSSHGRSGPGRWVYGSVAEKVLRGGCCNTLIIRAQVETPVFATKQILVPLDGSSLAEKALAPAFAIAEAIAGQVTLLRVVTAAHLQIETQTMKQQADYLEDHDQDEAEAYLQELHSRLPATTCPITNAFAKGPTADTIIDFSETQQMDLIVMSSHGRSGIERWIHGSVTEKVLRGAHCATLVVR
ncbi:MAG: universal stress protein [Chloroflexota bacterium]|nr:universal stress protein [Ardenticatenaceae bacterium]